MTTENNPTTGVTAPAGFRAAATTAGIKASGKPDMALVVNDGPHHVAAGVFTRNKIFAAPVGVSRSHLADGTLRAVVFNSGNANACTGSRGYDDARATADAVAAKLGCHAGDIGVCSTGVIGEFMPMDTILAGVEALGQKIATPEAATLAAGRAAAEAIMTTDTVAKQAYYQSADGWSIGGMIKGAGMIAPSLATMLGLLTTDAVIDAGQAQAVLAGATSVTVERLDVDGSTSTNDTIFLLSSGASGVEPDEEEFAAAVRQVLDDLATQMQSDAEGVTKRVSITVTGAADNAEALDAARTIGRDNLTKCAMFGSDPNWGRVLAAVGVADVDMDPDNITVTFNDHVVCRHTGAVEDSRNVDLTGPDIHVVVDLGTGGQGHATIKTTDLSLAYVEFNSAYTT